MWSAIYVKTEEKPRKPSVMIVVVSNKIRNKHLPTAIQIKSKCLFVSATVISCLLAKPVLHISNSSSCTTSYCVFRLLKSKNKDSENLKNGSTFLSNPPPQGQSGYTDRYTAAPKGIGRVRPVKSRGHLTRTDNVRGFSAFWVCRDKGQASYSYNVRNEELTTRTAAVL